MRANAGDGDTRAPTSLAGPDMLEGVAVSRETDAARSNLSHCCSESTGRNLARQRGRPPTTLNFARPNAVTPPSKSVVVAIFLEHDRLKKDVRQIDVGVAV